LRIYSEGMATKVPVLREMYDYERFSGDDKRFVTILGGRRLVLLKALQSV